MLRIICKEGVRKVLGPPLNGLKTLATNHLPTERELNQVTLLGTIVGPPKVLEKHTLLLLETQHHHAKTEEREAYSKNNWHRILVTKPQLRELVQGCIIAGDRLMVNGVITYLPFATDNGKFRQRAAILARELFRCNDGLEASPDAYDKSESDTTLG